MGLACATRQPAWFFAPFYVVATWKREGRRAALERAGIAAVAGLLPNLPFLIAGPGAFLGGVFAPTFGPLEAYGVGLIRYSMDGQLPFLPRGAYALSSMVAFATLLWLLWRRWRTLHAGALVFPSVVLWFAWRSLQNYFSFAGLFAMVGDDAIVADDASVEEVASPSRAPRPWT
jgi:uncharacterized membrane protein